MAAGAEDPELIFDFIDQDGSGEIDEKEATDALKCAVHWGLMTKEEAFGAIPELEKVAGDDKKISKAEAKAAMEAAGSSSGSSDGEEPSYSEAEEELAQDDASKCGPPPS